MVLTELDISLSLKGEVHAIIRKCLEIAEKHFKRRFAVPTVTYNLKGPEAGIARQSTNSIELNPTLLIQNQDHYLSTTVPHEVAHIIADVVFPSGHTNQHKRTKNIPHHGTGWRYVMNLLGVPAEVYHKYDVSSVVSKVRYKHRCSVCGQEAELTVKQAQAVKTDPTTLYHRQCGSKSVFIPEQHTSTPLTKLEKCDQLFVTFQNASRQEMMQLFVKHADVTLAGAATYYTTLKKKHGY